MEGTATNLVDDPSVGGYVLNGGDVTEARQAAEDLAAARDGALAASKAKSEFLATMSHEIRTPDERGDRADRAAARDPASTATSAEFAGGVKVSAENLLVIINDILDFSKIEAGKLDIEEAELDVAAHRRRRRAHPGRRRARQGARAARRHHPDVPDRAARRSGPGPAGAAQPRRPTRSSSPPRARWSSGSRLAERRRAGGASASRSIDTGIGIAAADQATSVPRLRPGRLVHDPQVRRHRARAGDLPPARRADGRHARA